MTFHQPSAVRAFAPAPAFACAEAGGPYGWLTPYVAQLAARNPGVAARVLRLRRNELHFIALCVSLMGERRDDADHFAAFARDYDRLRRRIVLRNCAIGADHPVSPRLADLAQKFAGSIWRPSAYRRIAALYEEPRARKTLAHLPSISRRQALVLARLPAEFRTQGILKRIRRPRDLPEVLFAIEIVRRVRTDLTDRQILASLERGRTEYLRGWVLRHYEQAPFPPPPTGALVVNGVDAIRPLACYDDLARAAREFDNCIRNSLWQVLKGDTYFYRYAPEAGGKGVAIIELRRAPITGWIVHEALGPSNDTVTAPHRQAILAAFRNADIPAAPQAAHRDAWFEIE